MDTSPAQITPDAVTIQVAPSDYVASQQKIIDDANAIIMTEQSNIDASNGTITRLQGQNVTSQANIDSSNAIIAAAQANIDAVAKVIPELAQTIDQNAQSDQSLSAQEQVAPVE